MEKKQWIQKHLVHIKTLENNHTTFTEQTVFKTAKRSLTILKWDKKSFRTTILNDKLLVKYPDTFLVTSADVQGRIRQAIEKTWKLEAEEILISRLHTFARYYKFEVSSVTIKNVTSKWGSCSYKNDIILSLHLMRLPQHLQDYVILHELCHTIEKNHQKPFWDLLNSVTKNQAKVLDKQVKQYNTKIY